MRIGSLVRRAKLEAYCGWKGDRTYSYYRQLLGNERRSPQEIEDLAWVRLKALVHHSYLYVPYYKKVFEGMGLTPQDIRTPQDFSRLPVLTKTLVRERHDELLSKTARPGSYRPHSTGGSTGQPLDFYRSWEYDELANRAGSFRSAHRAGWSPGEKMVWIWGRPLDEELEQPRDFVPRLRRRVGNWLRDSGVILCDAFDAGPDRMVEWVRTFEREKPRYMLGYTSALENFARFLESRRIALEGIRGVVSTAEALDSRQRELFQRVFGGLIVDQYGSREVCSIATSCERGVLHVNSDLVKVEFVDLAGTGSVKSIVVTDLNNDVFPFIRYEIGDCGAPADKPCRCGLPFPALQMQIGRVFDNFVTPDGRIVHGAFLKNLMDGVTGIERFQFRQPRPDAITLLVKKGGHFGPETEAYLEAVRARVRKDFHPDLEFQILYVEDIPLTTIGKYRYTVCEVRLPPSARQELVIN